MKKGVRFNHMGPQFAVDDVGQSVGFYAAVLGFGLDYLDGEVSALDNFWEMNTLVKERLGDLSSSVQTPEEKDHVQGIQETQHELVWIAERIFAGVADTGIQVNLRTARTRLREIAEEVADDMTALNQYYRNRTNRSVAVATAEAVTAGYIILIAVIVIIGQIMALVVLVRRWLVVPISRVATITEEISRGNFGARLRVDARDEWGQLSESVNRMSLSLKNYEARLRTKERLEAVGIHSVVFDPCANIPESGDYLSVMKKNLEALRFVFGDGDH